MNNIMNTGVETIELGQPREHHYLFAHQALPAMFHSAPERLLSLLAEQGHNLLRLWWHQVADCIEESDWLSAQGLDYELRRLDERTYLILITFPLPQNVTELYFAGLVYRPAHPNTSPWLKKRVYARYFTLEVGFELAGGLRPVLGEWLANGHHLQHGDGPAPEAALFVEAVRRLTRTPVSLPGAAATFKGKVGFP
jgi:hypothetical protein